MRMLDRSRTTLGIMTWIRNHPVVIIVLAAALVVAGYFSVQAVIGAQEQAALDQCNSRLIASGMDEYDAAARCIGVDPEDLYITE